MTENNSLLSEKKASPTDSRQGFENNREALIQKAIFTFIATDKMHRRAIDRRAAEIGLHRSQHRMLMYLAHCDAIPSQKDLAKHFDISPAAVAGTLKKLEADGYIERCKCSERQDSRFNEIRITEQGREATLQSCKYFQHVDLEATRGFSDAELDTFIKLLEKMQSNLKSCEINLPKSERTNKK